MKIDQPLRIRVVAADMAGHDLFGTDELVLEPGETFQWTYPKNGLPVTVDAPVRMEEKVTVKTFNCGDRFSHGPHYREKDGALCSGRSYDQT